MNIKKNKFNLNKQLLTFVAVAFYILNMA